MVDDGSRLSIAPVMHRFQNQLNLQNIYQDNAGPAAARNTGAARANGEFLVFTDDDCQPAPDWLNHLFNQIQQTPDCLIGGQTLNALPQNPFSSASQALVSYLYKQYNQDHQGAHFFTSNNMALAAYLFREMGGFDTTFPLAAGEDRDFCARWLAAGNKMTYVPKALIHHSHSLNLTGFVRQHFNYGRGACRFHKLRKNQNPGNSAHESAAFYLNLVFHPFAQSKNFRALLQTGLMFISQITNTAGYLWEMLNRNIFFSPSKKA